MKTSKQATIFPPDPARISMVRDAVRSALGPKFALRTFYTGPRLSRTQQSALQADATGAKIGVYSLSDPDQWGHRSMELLGYL